MTTQEQNFDIAWLVSLSPKERKIVLDALTKDDQRFVLADWRFWARKAQRPPDGSWRTWLFLGGRGSGKTRAGAEWIAEGVRNQRMKRVALIGATYAETRAVMIEGQSGLLAVSPAAVYEPTNRRVLWPSGAVATVLSADEPDSIRGHQFDGAWADEFGKWPDPQGALDMLAMALRLGADPRLCVTTTPRNTPALKTMIASRETTLTTSRTRDNETNLAPGFVGALEARYAGTRLGRQELDGDLIDDNESAVWKRDWIEAGRVAKAPALDRIVVAIDPPAGLDGDDCGIVVAGRAPDGHFYVLADRSVGGLTPTGWAERAVAVYDEFKADILVAEANQGGEMVRTLLKQASKLAPVTLVHATRDKKTRATPIAALYERGEAHHVRAFAELEDQMCQFDGTGPSPDRMDALVWALTDLASGERGEPKVRTL
ncbi:MAG TPA: terminase family protein [Rhizomicrobium sp.]|jgi:phage terminase large subunit-like protein|nr:terminase family protein [Rhizomicrobium sp.]